MSEDDIDQVVESYECSLLSSNDLSLLMSHSGCKTVEKRDATTAFYDRMKRGVFIWPLTTDELRDELSKSKLEEVGMVTRGRVLKAEDSKILAWLTYKDGVQRRDSLPTDLREEYDRKRIQTVRNYLENGVTNAPLQYAVPADKSGYIDNAGNTILFQDIKSNFPLASFRLGSLAFQEIGNTHLNNPRIIAYKLYNLVFSPPPDLLDYIENNKGHLVSYNDKSTQLFQQWGFKLLGIDANDGERAPVAVRENVAGITMQLRPIWEVVAGKTNEVSDYAQTLWRKIQHANGDLSEDAPGRV